VVSKAATYSKTSTTRRNRLTEYGLLRKRPRGHNARASSSATRCVPDTTSTRRPADYSNSMVADGIPGIARRDAAASHDGRRVPAYARCAIPRAPEARDRSGVSARHCRALGSPDTRAMRSAGTVRGPGAIPSTTTSSRQPLNSSPMAKTWPRVVSSGSSRRWLRRFGVDLQVRRILGSGN
jgi:hypothetical protein